mmetsp:Transcript_10036/g.25037  ORF Transcript_10036/g.25037 Transcript_10036/m.25037 type:complete len:254 (+) Transcript_10036:126-887(+)
MPNPTDPRTKEAVDFIAEVLGEPLPSDDFHAALKDGVILCNMLNKAKPGSIKKVNKQRVPFMQMENIESYLEACHQLGMKLQESFVTVDLYEAKNLNQVVQNLISLKRILGFGFCKQNQTDKPARAVDMSDDQSTDSDKLSSKYQLKETPQEVPGAVIAKVQGMMAGHSKVDSSLLAEYCKVCEQAISGACINACSKKWHPNCFLCKKCGQKMGLQRYFEEAGYPYCERCFHALKNPASNIHVETRDMGFSFD